MCIKKEPEAVYQPIADLDAEVPRMIRSVTLGLDRGAISRLGLNERGRTSGAWVGAVAYYSMLENL